MAWLQADKAWKMQLEAPVETKKIIYGDISNKSELFARIMYSI